MLDDIRTMELIKGGNKVSDLQISMMATIIILKGKCKKDAIDC